MNVNEKFRVVRSIDAPDEMEEIISKITFDILSAITSVNQQYLKNPNEFLAALIRAVIVVYENAMMIIELQTEAEKIHFIKTVCRAFYLNFLNITGIKVRAIIENILESDEALEFSKWAFGEDMKTYKNLAQEGFQYWNINHGHLKKLDLNSNPLKEIEEMIEIWKNGNIK